MIFHIKLSIEVLLLCYINLGLEHWVCFKTWRTFSFAHHFPVLSYFNVVVSLNWQKSVQLIYLAKAWLFIYTCNVREFEVLWHRADTGLFHIALLGCLVIEGCFTSRCFKEWRNMFRFTYLAFVGDSTLYKIGLGCNWELKMIDWDGFRIHWYSPSLCFVYVYLRLRGVSIYINIRTREKI